MGRLIQAVCSVGLLSCVCTANAGAAEIRVYPGKADEPAIIALTGDIVSGDQSRFAAIAAANSNAILVLNSSGGALIPAIEIGKATRLRGYQTVVYGDGVCASACALIWTAGSRRIIAGTGRIGFHASYRDENGKLVETGVGNAVVGHYLAQLGYSETAVIFATSAPPDKIRWLNAQTAPTSDITYEVRDADQTSSVEIRTGSESAPVSDVFSGGDAYVDSSPTLVRNVEAFANALEQRSYKVNINKSNSSSPSILMEAGGYKMGISFSSCTGSNCNYAELMAAWEDVNATEANEVVRKYALDENFANIYYDKNSKTLWVYHYMILGRDGVTIGNMVENIEYFLKDFGRVASLLGKQ